MKSYYPTQFCFSSKLILFKGFWKHDKNTDKKTIFVVFSSLLPSHTMTNHAETSHHVFPLNDRSSLLLKGWISERLEIVKSDQARLQSPSTKWTLVTRELCRCDRRRDFTKRLLTGSKINKQHQMQGRLSSDNEMRCVSGSGLKLFVCHN